MSDTPLTSKQPSISDDACYERLKAQRDRLAVENERLREYIARTAVSGGRQSEPPAVDVAPIAKLTVRDGLVQRAGLYAPGLRHAVAGVDWRKVK